MDLVYLETASWNSLTHKGGLQALARRTKEGAFLGSSPLPITLHLQLSLLKSQSPLLSSRICQSPKFQDNHSYSRHIQLTMRS